VRVLDPRIHVFNSAFNLAGPISIYHFNIMPITKLAENDSQPQRSRLLVILGAGSTKHAGAPLTKDIDEFVCQMPDEPIRAVVNRLRDQRSDGNWNFETVLAALEELDEFSLRKRCPTVWPRIGGPLSAFAELLPDFVNAAGNSFLVVRTQLIGRIKKFVIDGTTNASAARLKAFFDLLKAEFDLTIVTLNYDDLIDRAGEWYDGFCLPIAPAKFSTFDFSGFRDRSAQDPAVLMHLHGSVRFDFPPFSPEPSASGEIIQYNAPRELHAMLKPPGGIAQPTPIIAGDGKDRWMTRACVPFGYYYNAFINTVQTCPRILVAGYGFGDLHVNSWLKEEHPRIHGTRRRIVHIDPAAPKLPRTLECLTLAGDDGKFPPQKPSQIQEIIDYFKSA
jgi:SIR2-like domain